MKIINALYLICELAEDNVADERELPDEWEKQNQALNMVSDFASWCYETKVFEKFDEKEPQS